MSEWLNRLNTKKSCCIIAKSLETGELNLGFCLVNYIWKHQCFSLETHNHGNNGEDHVLLLKGNLKTLLPNKHIKTQEAYFKV